MEVIVRRVEYDEMEEEGFPLEGRKVVKVDAERVVVDEVEEERDSLEELEVAGFNVKTLE